MQAGQRSGILRSVGNESNTITSVLSPVGTSLPKIGQRIMILGKLYSSKRVAAKSAAFKSGTPEGWLRERNE
jgi:hypothetical protein